MNMIKKLFKISLVILILLVAIYNSLFYVQTLVPDMTQYSQDKSYRLEVYRPLTVTIKAYILPFYKESDHETHIKLFNKEGRVLNDTYDYFMQELFNNDGDVKWSNDNIFFRIANSKGEMEIVEWKLK